MENFPTPETINSFANLLEAVQWPLVALILALFFGNEIRSVLKRMKTVKGLGLEAELQDAVDDLVDSSTIPRQVESTSASGERSVPSDQSPPSDEESESSSEESFAESLRYPRMVVLEIGAELEQTMRRILVEYEANGGVVSFDATESPSVHRLLLELLRLDLIPSWLYEKLQAFYEVRNMAAHSNVGDDQQLMAAIGVGRSLLGELRNILRNVKGAG